MMKTKTIALLLLVVLVAATTSVEAHGFPGGHTCSYHGGNCISSYSPCLEFRDDYRCFTPGTRCCVRRSHYG